MGKCRVALMEFPEAITRRNGENVGTERARTEGIRNLARRSLQGRIQISLRAFPSAFSILARTALARFSPLVRLSSRSGLSFHVLRQMP